MFKILLRSVLFIGAASLALLASPAVRPAHAARIPIIIPPNSSYLPGQVLVTGPLYAINRFRDLYNQSAVLLSITNLTYLGQLPDNYPVPFTNKELQQLYMGKFLLEKTMDVEKFVRTLEKDARFQDLLVTPNYITAEPWGLGGSPWGLGGSPVVNGAYTSTQYLYKNQFSAMNTFGMEPLAIKTLPFAHSDTKVPIAIFDTSPFSQPDDIPKYQAIQGVKISVTHLLLPSGLPTSTAFVPGHGSYVAGLVNVLAPKAPLYLYKVLDDSGIGDVGTLIEGLSRFSQTIGTKAVINLSLNVKTEYSATVEPMRTVLSGMFGLNFTILAATGNDSAGQALAGNSPAAAPAPELMRLPAAYPFVIGVSAANAKGNRACYSNAAIGIGGKKGIGAPGGEGETGGGGCEPPSVHTCTNDSMCLFTSWWMPGSAKPAFAYGAGTSFATPFASAYAAMMIDELGAGATSQQVAEKIYASVKPSDPNLGYGIIQLGGPPLKKLFMPALQK